MRIIPLTQGYSTMVDDEDYTHLSENKWGYHHNGYAVRAGVNGLVLMHREIMNTPDHLDCDHKDGDGLNNQRFNLRNCTKRQNNMNRKCL